MIEHTADRDKRKDEREKLEKLEKWGAIRIFETRALLQYSCTSLETGRE